MSERISTLDTMFKTVDVANENMDDSSETKDSAIFEDGESSSCPSE